MQRIRSFIAFDITSDEILQRLSNIQKELTRTGASLRLVKPRNIHVTLRFLGEIPESMVEKVSRELDEIAFSPFEIRLKGMGAFPSLRRIRVVWVRIEEGAKELNDIFMQLESRLRKLGFPPERRGFVPHITIARVKTGRNIPILARCIESFSDFDFGIMKADRLRLKRSVLTPKGPIYSVLHEKVAISR